MMIYVGAARELTGRKGKECARSSGGRRPEGGEVADDVKAHRAGGGECGSGGDDWEWSSREKRHYIHGMATHIRGIFTCKKLRWDNEKTPKLDCCMCKPESSFDDAWARTSLGEKGGYSRRRSSEFPPHTRKFEAGGKNELITNQQLPRQPH